MSPFEILAISPSLPVVAAARADQKSLRSFDTSIAAAAKQAGYLGMIDLAFVKLSSETKTELANAIELGYGLRLSVTQLNELAAELKSLLPKIKKKERQLTIILAP